MDSGARKIQRVTSLNISALLQRRNLITNKPSNVISGGISLIVLLGYLNEIMLGYQLSLEILSLSKYSLRYSSNAL